MNLKADLRLERDPASMIRFSLPWHAIRSLFLTGLMALVLLPTGASAQGLQLQDLQRLAPSANRPLPADQAFRIRTEWTGEGTLDVRFEIAKGYYLYRDRLMARAAEGAAPVVASMPGEQKDDPNFGATEVWHDRAFATVSGVTGPVTLSWQGCQEAGLCYPPQTREFVPPVRSTPALLTAQAASGEAEADRTGAEKGVANPGMTLSRDQGMVEGLAARGGVVLVVLAFFGFGLLLAFTPCVLPMVPIVAGMLGTQGERLTPLRGLLLTGAYVLAMATAFAGLGLVAAWSGQNLQIALQAPATIIAVAGLFTLLALASFGLFALRLPQALSRRVEAVRGPRGTLAGAALLGFTSALIVGPCVTAPLAGAFLYIAQTGDTVLGASALFALGLGQGVPLLGVGLFGAAVLPRMGGWMVGINRAFGVVFLGVAIWLLSRLLPGPATLGLWALLLISAGVMLGARDRLAPDTPVARRLGAALGLVALLAGALQAIGAASGAGDPLRPLERLTARASDAAGPARQVSKADFAKVMDPQALQSALVSAKDEPALIYVTADWCTSCRTIERSVLPDAAVQAALSGVALIAIDVTRFEAPQQALLDELGAVGPPTLIFLDGKRAEPDGTRLVGEVAPKALTASLTRIAR